MSTASPGAAPSWRRLLSTALVIAYPGLVYVGLTRWDVRSVAGITVAMLGTMALLRWAHVGRASVRSALAPLVPGLALACAAGVVREPGFLLAAPVLVSMALLWAFASSLRKGRTPMVERFARMQERALPPGGGAYCRTVTKIWSAFFVVNGSVAAVLAVWGSLELWTLYTGLLAYLAMGAIFTVEYVVRKARFRRYGRGPLDRIVSRVFPPPETEPK